MNGLRQFLFRLGGTFRKRKQNADMSAELQEHLELRIERNIENGMTPEEARYAAMRSFGGVEQIKERCRDQRVWIWLEQMLQDMRYAARGLTKSPGFFAVAVLSLALGIGTNTAVFSLANAVLLKMLPVKDPQELVIFNWVSEENVRPYSYGGWLEQEFGTSLHTSTSFSISSFEAFRKQPSPLTDIFAFSDVGSLNVSVDGASEIVWNGQVVSGNYYVGLGVTAAAGRLIAPSDDIPGADPAVVISYGYWLRRFGGDATVVGKSISINRVPVTIIGVSAQGFNGTMQVGQVVDVTLPLALSQRIMRSVGDDHDPSFWWVRIMGRLKPGATIAQACSSLVGVFHESARGRLSVDTLPGAPAVDPTKIPLPRLRAEPGGQGLYEARRHYERSIRLLMGVVALVLIIACVNVANLLLARSAARHREIAVRIALGASRGRVIRQLLTESVLLAALAAAAGLVFAIWGARLLVVMRPFGGFLQLDTSMDWRVLGFTTVVALATGIVFGLAPAFSATRLNLTSEFQGGLPMAGTGSRSRLAKLLMIVQVALSLILLVGAGLFLRTLHNLQNVDVGFNRTQLLLFGVNAPASGSSSAQAIATYDEIRERIAGLPGVRHASYASVALLGESNWNTTITVPGYVEASVGESVRVNNVDPAYLKTMEIPLVRGRDFAVLDGAGAPKVAIINQSFAKKYFGTEDAVGRRFGNGGSASANTEIIGVVRDTKYSEVKQAPGPVVIFPFSQQNAETVHEANFVVRFTGDDTAITAAIRQIVHEINSGLPVTDVRTQQEQIDRLFTAERLLANLCSFLGGLALVLAAVGLHGLMSYAVLRRRNEIGVRMALGARPADVLRMILRESLVLVMLGLLVGVGSALGTMRAVASLLFGLSAGDPITFVSASMLLLTVAIFASWLPARRAAKVDPMVALRCE